MKSITLIVVLSAIALSGCANNPKLGEAVALAKHEQTYNRYATAQNADDLVEGSGERSQVAVKGYNKNKTN